VKEPVYDIYIMVISGTVVLFIVLCFLVSFFMSYRNRQTRYEMEVKAMKEQYDQEILRTQLEIKEQTLKNISEEIHDNVGQVLSLAILNLSAIELADREKAALKIERITDLVKKGVSDLRDLSKALDPDNITNVGLAAIIRFELDMLEKTGVYRTTFSVVGREEKLAAAREIVVYRIVQESLNNIMKHARGTEVEIRLAYTDEQLVISIADNGKGFEASMLETNDVHQIGAGIRNMKNRAILIGGMLEVKSVPLKGTQVAVTIPFVTKGIQY